MGRYRRTAFVAAALVLCAACGGSDDEESVDDPTTTEAASPSGGDVTTSTEPDDELPEGIEPTDYLTFANGAVVVGVEGLPDGNVGAAMKPIDGNPISQVAASSGTTTDITFVYELPAPTTFDRLAVPGVYEPAGNATFFEEIEVAGAADAVDGTYTQLATATLEAPGDARRSDPEQVTELDVVGDTPVRWVRLQLSGGLLLEEGEEDKTNLEFTEIIGNGTQETVEQTDAFTGIWSYKPADAPQTAGELLELTQSGTTVTGCLGRVNLTGTVNGSILRANGIDPLDETPSVYVLQPDGSGGLQGVSSERSGTFVAYIAPVAPEGSSTPCSETVVDTSVCDSVVYVNFDVNSAEIRAESEPVLDDLHDRLRASEVSAVSIEGHTSTEGTDEDNLDLSVRRAEAVVTALVERGSDQSTLSADGKGENEPLVSPDDDESARSLNRRVEIVCV